MPVTEHNVAVGARWGAAGKHYEEISRQIADSIQHAVDRLDARPGERVLDLATGTGWTARLAAESGASVIGVDIAADKIAAARELSDPSIEYKVGDAEDLDFDDAVFDAVISTCGVQFVTHPEAAAGELARVVRPGGRFVATLWTPESSIADMFRVFKKYMPAPPAGADPPPTPFAWGTRERLDELLGGAFEFGIERAVSYYRAPTPEDAWRAFRDSYGPSKQLYASLPDDRKAELAEEFTDLYRACVTDLGVLCPREYVLVRAVRKG